MLHSSETKIIGLEVAGPKEAHCYSYSSQPFTSGLQVCIGSAGFTQVRGAVRTIPHSLAN